MREIAEDTHNFLGAAPSVQDSNGVFGVGLLLGALATASRKAAGASNLHSDLGRPRVLVSRLLVDEPPGQHHRPRQHQHI